MNREPEPLFAAHGTVLGQMQRGLGRIHRAVQNRTNISCMPELMACLGANPSMGLQESGVPAYYASIATSLRVDAHEIAALVGKCHPDEWNTGGLAAPVLMEMVLRGNHEARYALLGALQGEGWLWAAQSLGVLEHYDRMLTDAEFEQILAVLTVERLQCARCMSVLPMRRWAQRSNALRRSHAEVGLSGPEAVVATPKVDPSLSTQQLLKSAVLRNQSEVVCVLQTRREAETVELLIAAAQEELDSVSSRIGWSVLGLQSNPALLPAAVERLKQDGGGPDSTRRVWASYLLRMPFGEIRRLAREYLGVAWAANLLMAQCAEQEDRDRIEEGLLWALEGNERYDVGLMAQALGRVADRRSQECLERAFVRTIDRSARTNIVQSLFAMEVYSSLFEEALWDSDPETRLYGAAFVAAEDPAILTRLGELTDDPWEDEYVKKEASGALQDVDP